jgi:ATP-binding cassette subfamily F protein 3
MKLGYLHQVYSDNEEKLVREELAEAFSQIQEMDKKLKDLEQNMTEHPEIIEQYTSLLEQFNNIGGYDFENKIHNVANGMGILELLDKKLVEVSG